MKMIKSRLIFLFQIWCSHTSYTSYKLQTLAAGLPGSYISGTHVILLQSLVCHYVGLTELLITSNKSLANQHEIYMYLWDLHKMNFTMNRFSKIEISAILNVWNIVPLKACNNLQSSIRINYARNEERKPYMWGGWLSLYAEWWHG